jgi:replicative DNA helicase
MGDPRIVPKDLDAETALLGGLLLSPAAVDTVYGVLPVSEDAFYDPRHVILFNALVKMHGNGEPIDIVTLEDYLASHRGHLDAKTLLEDVGGREYLIDLVRSVPSAANVEYYARIVARKGRLRSLIQVGHRLYNAPFETDADPDRIAEDLELAVLRLRGHVAADLSKTAAELGRELVQSLEDGEGEDGLTTGFDAFDHHTGGMRPGQYILLAARPSVGKSAMAVQIAAHVAMRLGVGVVFFSVEMAGRPLIRRLFAQQTGIFGNKLRGRDRLSDNEMDLLRRCQLPDNLHIIECPGLTGADLRSRARAYKMRHRIGLVVIDYLGLMTDPAGARQNKETEVSNLSRSIKTTARELEVPVLCLHSLSRSSVHDKRPPDLQDLRGSGALEHDSDIVLFLHQTQAFKVGERPPMERDVRLMIRKDREGGQGSLNLSFNGPLTMFREKKIDRHGPPAPPSMFDERVGGEDE